jgi:hypothetical protein
MRKYLYSFIILSLAASYAWVYHYGKAVIQARYDRAALEYREKENRLLAQLEEAKKKREIIYKERVARADKIIDQCLDRDLPDDVKRLLNAAGSQT